MRNETIAAISTGMTASGISIVRISGPDAVRIADCIFAGKFKLSEVPSHTLHYGRIEKDGAAIDEALVSVMRAPHTYTGEDTVEINCHGGLFLTKKVLEAVLSAGAKLAEPGEFTKRAFLNGRMDLSRAESVMSLISAENEHALKAGIRGLQGRIAEKIRSLRDRILDEISFIEAALDDPEHYSLDGYAETLAEKVSDMEDEAAELLRRSENGSILREGVRTVIAGRPNAGKSSLINLLSGFEKSIVTEIPGTTRDIVEEPVRFGHVTLLLRDTAGLRPTDDPVERIGVDRAKEALDAADLVLYLVEAAAGKTAMDDEVLAKIPAGKVLILYNKADLVPAEARRPLSAEEGLYFSCRTEEGLEALETAVEKRFYAADFALNEEVVLTTDRQMALLKDAMKSLAAVSEGIREGVSEEFLSADLLSAYTFLGQILGEAVADDVVDRVFEKFCMGK